MSNHPHNSQVVWVVEIDNISDQDTNIHLYESEQDAMSDAVDVAIEYMKELGCDDPLNSKEWNDVYREVVAAKAANDFNVAMKAYAEWNSDHQNYEDVYNIFIYSSSVTPNSKINMQMFINPSVEAPLDKAPLPSKVAKVVDVPCKQCSRNVSTNETTCWYCGIMNPAIK